MEQDRRRLWFGVRAALGLCVLAWISGCHEDKGPRTVANEDPTVKIPAIQRDVKKRDLKEAPQMVKDLDSDDPAVRFYAIEGLKRLTGEDFGYRYYDDEDKRKPAVMRWQDWLKTRQGVSGK